MKGQTDEFGVLVVIGVLLLGVLLGAINGTLVVITRVPDIVVTLAMSFVWAGCALLVLRTPGGGSAKWLRDLVLGPLGNEWIPKAGVVLIVIVGPDLDSGAALPPWVVALRDRQQPAGSLPERRIGRPDQDPRLHAGWTVLGARRPGAHRQHRHRHPGARSLHPAERRCRRARRGKPCRRPRRRLRARSSPSHPPAASGPT